MADLLDDQVRREVLRVRRRAQIAAAEQRLRDDANFDWLFDGVKRWWTVQEVAVALGVADSTVRGWCKVGRIRGALDHGKRVGWRMPRNGLVVWCAHVQKGGQ